VRPRVLSDRLLPCLRPPRLRSCCCSEHTKAQQQRQRQAAAEARLAEQEAESAARQRKAARGDAVSAYKTLLAEVVRDAGASFQSWQPKLAKDPLVGCRLSVCFAAACPAVAVTCLFLLRHCAWTDAPACGGCEGHVSAVVVGYGGGCLAD
jgi:hypothetical protein